MDTTNGVHIPLSRTIVNPGPRGTRRSSSRTSGSRAGRAASSSSCRPARRRTAGRSASSDHAAAAADRLSGARRRRPSRLDLWQAPVTRSRRWQRRSAAPATGCRVALRRRARRRRAGHHASRTTRRRSASSASCRRSPPASPARVTWRRPSSGTTLDARLCRRPARRASTRTARSRSRRPPRAAGTAVGLSSFASKPIEEVAAREPADLLPDVLARHAGADDGGDRPGPGRGREGADRLARLRLRPPPRLGQPADRSRLAHIDLPTLAKHYGLDAVRARAGSSTSSAGGVPPFPCPNLGPPGEVPMFFGKFVEWMQTPPPTWSDIAWLREQWGGPFVVKGIAHPDDAARQAMESGRPRSPCPTTAG